MSEDLTIAIAATAAAAGLIVGLSVPCKAGPLTSAQWHAIAAGLSQCAYEDSNNCVWWAEDTGNGQGRSFVELGGVTYYLEDAL